MKTNHPLIRIRERMKTIEKNKPTKPRYQKVLEVYDRSRDELLAKTQLSIKEVAYASGFNDPNYFSRMFRRMEGLTPSEFRVPSN